MLTKEYKCHCCNSTNIVKAGRNRNGNQKYRCKNCGTTRVLEYKPPYSQEKKEEILRAYQERSSLRGLTRTFGVARATVSKWLKKSQNDSQQTSALSER
jgi:transposase-like protein